MKKILLVVGTIMLFASSAFAAQCVVELQTVHGRFLEDFRARGYDVREACHIARNDCYRELNYRHRMGRNPHAQCIIVARDHGGYNPRPHPRPYPRPYPQPQPQPRPERRRITCESNDMRFDRCYLDRGARNVQIVRQISDSSCIRGRTWGSDGDSIWVDHGCRAIFSYELPRRRF